MIKIQFKVKAIRSNSDLGWLKLVLIEDSIAHFSGSLIRQIGQFGGDLSMFLPRELHAPVHERLRHLRDHKLL